MDFKRTNSSKKIKKSHSSSTLVRVSSSPKNKKQSRVQHNHTTFNNQKKKKQSTGALKKKKIQDLKTPDLLIKVSYKGKKLSIPISTLDDKGISQTLLPHIIRFQKQILKNPQFNPLSIENWKTVHSQDILKDYYLLTNKSLKPFKGQVLQVEANWKKGKSNKIKLSDFQIIRCVGTGGFSRVYLARYKKNGRFYGLKLMEKDGLLQGGKDCVVLNERDIMVDLDNPHILSLQFAFQTKHFVVLALQYCIGGQLFYYLRKVKRMNEDQARYCFMEILMGIQYLHSKKIIYRDIKPQNIMIDQDGNLKIADFGLSRKGIKTSQLAFTFCGSPQYMAPQMLSKTGHTFSVDYYCLGALLYQLVTGNPPFYSRDVQKIYYSIQNQQIDFPRHVELSEEIKMLLQGLLTKDPKRRLGSLGGIKQIMGHPWVRKIKPIDILERNIQTPINIDILSWNINDDDIDDIGSDYGQKIKDNQSDFQEMFQGFYYNRYQSMNIVEQILPSIKSDSTKENRNSIKKNKRQRNKFIHKSQSRQKISNKFGISIKTQTKKLNQISQVRFRGRKTLKKIKSKKQITLVQRSKKKNDKSSNKQKKIKQKKSILSPESVGNILRRIKSSTGLHNKSNF